MRSVLVGFFRGLNDLLQSPQKVIWICLGLVMFNMVVDGSLLNLVSLYQDHTQIQERIVTINQKTKEMKARLRRARDPAFMEREARDRFDLVSEGDLVFLFSEEEEPN